MDLFITGLVIIGIAVLYFIFDFFYKRYKNSIKGNQIRAMLFQKIGDEKIYQGSYLCEEKEDAKLGIYIYINKLKKAISGLSDEDFFPDKQVGRCILLCKYSEDDYRPMIRIKSESWYRKLPRAEEDLYETEEVQPTEEGGEVTLKFSVDEKGELIRKKDENGEDVRDFYMENYIEPLGVTQQAREAMRFNRDFTNRMRELRNEKGGFWDKWGNLLLSVGMVMLMFLAMAYNTNKTTETQVKISQVWGEKADEAIEEMKSPLLAERLLANWEKKNVEDNAPPD